MKTGRKLCRTGILFLAAVSALCLLFSACAGSPGAKTAPQISELVIVHTNDHHGTLFPENDGAGGLAPRMTFLRKVRAEHKNVLLLDAGDLNTGGAVSNLFLAIRWRDTTPWLSAIMSLTVAWIHLRNRWIRPDLNGFLQM